MSETRIAEYLVSRRQSDNMLTRLQLPRERDGAGFVVLASVVMVAVILAIAGAL